MIAIDLFSSVNHISELPDDHWIDESIFSDQKLIDGELSCDEFEEAHIGKLFSWDKIVSSLFFIDLEESQLSFVISSIVALKVGFTG